MRKHSWIGFVLFVVLACILLPAAPLEAGPSSVCGNYTMPLHWTTTGSPYTATCSVTISDTTLIIDPGVTVKFAGGAGLYISNSTLTAVGTSTSRIIFTSSAAAPAPGNWDTITFYDGSAVSASRISYATISYGGWGGGAIYVYGSSPIFDNITVTYSSTAGILVNASTATPTVNNSTLSNDYYGINLSAGGISLTNTTISNNTSYAIQTNANTRLSYSGLTVTGNGSGTKNAIGYGGGTISGNDVWHAGLDWVVLSNTTISSTGMLTIDPGVTVRFAGTALTVAGKLTAIGTGSSRITFTTNAAAAPAPGGWRSITFSSTASPLSQISYATISYGGAADGGCIYVNGSSPILDNITASYSSTAGILANGSTTALNVSNSTINNNTTYGVNLSGGGGVNLTNDTIANNTDFAIGADAGTRLSFSGLTVTGNGAGAKNSVGYRGGSSSINEVWHSGLDWIVLGSTTISQPGSLTIDPGTTVRFASATYLLVYGTLTAVGTASSRIVLTSSATSPAPGSWRSITFAQSGSSPGTGQISYADISYAGATDGGAISVGSGSAPTIDHVNLSNSSSAGIRIVGSNSAPRPTPTITNSTFVSNVSGINVSQYANPVMARLNYWNSTDGPSGSGTGAGQSVTAGVIFDPWLTTAPAEPQYLNSVAVTNRTFNPTISANLKLNFGTSQTGNWKAIFFDGSNNIVRTLTGTGASASVVWDGRNDGGSSLPSGNYSYQLESTATGGSAAPAHGTTVIDATRLVTISNLAISQTYFSPNGDAIQDSTTLSATFDFDDTNWSVNVRDASNNLVQTVSGVAGSVSYTWNGANSNGQMQPDGLYILELLATEGSYTAGGNKSVTLDNTFPAITITSPIHDAFLSNFYQSGVTAIPIVGTASDKNMTSWYLDRGDGTLPTAWTNLRTSNVPVTASTLYTWATDGIPNGTYTLRLWTRDKAGNYSEMQKTFTIGNFLVSQDVKEFDATKTGAHVTYTSTLPFTLTESLIIKNESGQVVRTLFNNVSRSAGSYSDAWDGRSDSGTVLPDGGYFHFATVTDGTNSFTLDLSGKFWNIGNQIYDLRGDVPFDPFDNVNLKVQQTMYYPGRVTVYFRDSLANSYVFVHAAYHESGTYLVYWGGFDDTGKYFPALGHFENHTDTVPQNTVVLFGTKPVVTNLRIDPPVSSPGAGASQTISFNLATYQNQPVTVTASFVNQDSLSKLRTITMSSISPGAVTMPWNGRSDDGTLVAPGYYSIFLTINDSTGNKVAGELIATIQY